MEEELEEKHLIPHEFQVHPVGEHPAFYLPQWHPSPIIRMEKYKTYDPDGEVIKIDRITAFIGAQQWKLKTVADLEKFLYKSVPTFCELK